jgi:hypothetical protein
MNVQKQEQDTKKLIKYYTRCGVYIIFAHLLLLLPVVRLNLCQLY